MKRTTSGYRVAWVGFLVIMVAVPSSLNGEGSVDAYYATQEKITAVEKEIEGLAKEKEGIQAQYEERLAEVKKWEDWKELFTNRGERRNEELATARRALAETEREQQEFNGKKERLQATKQELEEQLKKDIPPPPRKSHVTPAPDDFETQRKQAYENYVWDAKFAPNQEDRDSARGIYRKEMEAIGKDEAAAQSAAKKKKRKKQQQQPKKSTRITGTTSNKVAVPKQPLTPVLPLSTTTPASTSGSGPGKEDPPEVWEVGDDAPPWLFLTDEEIRVKKEAFKMSEYGFREIRTPDGRVLDVVADKDPSTESPPVGYITAGKGKDAKTTAYKYREDTVPGTAIQRSTKNLVAKRVFLSVNEKEQIAAIRKKQLQTFNQDTVTTRIAHNAYANADFEKQDAKHAKFAEAARLRMGHWVKFERQIRKLDPNYELSPPPIESGRRVLELYLKRQAREQGQN
jgi:hypothetical protein